MADKAVTAARRSFSVRTVYKCDVCGIEFGSEDEIVQHMDDHENGVQTDDMSRAESPSNAAEHLAATSNSNGKQELKQTVRTRSVVNKRHSVIKRLAAKKKSLVCNICQRTFVYAARFKHHMENAHLADDVSDCDVAEFENMPCKIELLAEESSSQEQITFQDASSTSAAVDNEELMSSIEGITEADEVTTVSDDVGAILNSVQLGYDELNTTYNSLQCSSQLHSSDELEQHVSRLHGADVFACTMCSEHFTTRNGLSRHVNIYHSGSTPFPCELCGDRFGTVDERSAHLEQHAPDMCVTCGIRLRRHTSEGFDPSIVTCGICYQQQFNTNLKTFSADSENPESASADDAAVKSDPRSAKNCVCRCMACGRGFQTRSNLRRHMRTHAVSKKDSASMPRLSYECTECGRLFTWQTTLRSHLRWHSQQEKRTGPRPKIFPCVHCSQKFAWTQNLKRHVRHSHRVIETSDTNHLRKFCCPQCDQSFGDQKDFLQHMCSAHKTASSLNSSSADVANRPKADLKKKASPDKLFGCPECGLSFAWQSGVHYHMRTKHPQLGASNVTSEAGSDGKFRSCHLCTQQFCTLANLLRHLERMHGTTELPPGSDATDVGIAAQSYVCPKCNQHFFWASNLRKHMNTKHRSEMELELPSIDQVLLKCQTDADNFSCIKCHRRFVSIYRMRLHLIAHVNAENASGIRQFLCNECGRCFGDARQLRVHMFRHTGVKPHQCSACGKSFVVVSQLNEHVATVHEGRRYICEQCGHEAKSRSALHTHVRGAHAEPGTVRPFACTVCTRRFWSAAALRRHDSAHADTGTAKRKSMCAICSLLFRHVSNLSHHLKTVHANETHATPFACATCSQQFEQPAAFKSHYRSKHRNR